jgi:hypothetical protein
MTYEIKTDGYVPVERVCTYPVAGLKPGEHFEVEGKDAFAKASRYAYVYAYRHRPARKFSCRWVANENKGYIYRKS